MDVSNEPDRLKLIRDSHQALAILRVAYREPSYRINDHVLGDYLHELALGGTTTDLHANLEALEKAGVVKVTIIERVRVIELTERGSEVAHGKVVQEGILRPGPECPY